MAAADAMPPSPGDDDRPVLGPAELLGPVGADLPPLPPSAVVVFDHTHRTGRAIRRHRWPFRMVSLPTPELAIVVAGGPGAPTAAVTVEMLGHLRVEQMVVVGVCGSLGRMPLATGDLVVGQRAISDDGTAPRYPEPPEPAAGLTALAAEMSEARSVTTVSTDVPFRHTARTIAAFAEQADVIEMEAAAVFAAARTVGVEAAALLAVSDHYHGDGWRLGDRGAVTASARHAVGVASQTLLRRAGERPV
ncbi:MAG: hypothetical protein AAF467_28145 [Actinomycetota bacterium]